ADGYFAAVGQEDAKTGAGSARGVNAAEADGAFVLLNDAFADPEAKASALGGLGGEKRLKEAPRIFVANTVSGVADGDGDAAPLGIPVGGVGDTEAEGSARRHGLNGIADE